jgi:hypothetical protein
MLEAVEDYGPIKKGRDYVILDCKHDWYKVLIHGRAIYAPNWVFNQEI